MRIPQLVIALAWLVVGSALPVAAQQTVSGERLRTLAAAPIVLQDAAVLRQRAPGATKYVSEWYVDSQNGATVWNSFDSLGGVYTPSILRALSLSLEAPLSITGTLTVSSNTNVSGVVGHPDYVSQVSKWRVTNEGAADFRYLFTDELHAKAFIADLEQALAGGQIISKSVAVIAEDFRCPATPGLATLVVEDLPGAPDMQVFEVNDFVVVRTFARAAGSLTIGDCVGTVESPDTTATGTQSWVFRRGTTNTGAMAEGTIVPKKGLVVDYGISGNGYYEVSAIDGVYGANSPYAQIVTWTTAPTAANRTVRARFGRLTGITGVSNEYGMIAGVYAASNGQFFRASNTTFELHGINLLMWDGATNVFKIDRTAPSLALGSPVPSGYSGGTGVWMGNDAGTYKFRVGVPGGQGAFWDGLTFAINGNLTATTGTIGGWTIGATSLSATADTVGMSSAITGGDDVRFWAGHATPTSAPFRVTEAGAITSTSGTIGGWTLGATSLTAGSGATTVGLDSGGTNPAIYAGSATPGSAPFRVTNAGAVTATNATITGSITSTSGAIGGFSIDSTTLSASNLILANTGNITVGTGNSVGRLSSSDGTWRLWVGNATAGSAPFRVDTTGFVFMGDAFISLDLDVAGLLTIGTNGTLNVNSFAGTGNRAVCAAPNGNLLIC